ncbi:hypothetical protein TRFO_14485 [Tritrichomonas foetus]|uniref:Uncharacterized protein n=1 Tax=Tritrichomonas foetus TaxID=1144522 RepID=A0A1J4KVE8_9EUKA|nr:hypothetical protein TRFO_14485 [Tritrichomonas foetus]|eukprot:OHT15122.1 hypothetical protein TRFO_14485 [Tritrichomonas foetus]
MTIYEEFNAFYSPFDPNSLISLFLYLAQFNKNCFQTAHSLFTLRKFLKGPFNYWITSKEDIFALFFAAFVSPIDFKSIILNSTSSKFSTNDLNSYPNNSQSKNSNDSQKSLELNSSFLYLKPCNLTDELQNSSYRRKLEVLKDYFSNTEHNIEILFSIIERCLPVQRENIHCSRFFTTVKKLIKKTQNKRQFNLLGELRIRIQSPEFTIIDDCYDRCLFMAGLLKISEFASYYENEYLMCFCLERMNEYIFNEKELKKSTMISEYHYEFASKIVAPWISLFTNFYPLEEQVKNIQNTIHYWKSKTETDSEP